MLIKLKRDADPQPVEAALQGLGLWTERLLGASGRPEALSVGPCSAAVARERITALAGVDDVWEVTSRHPRVDAAREGIVTITAGVSLAAGALPVLIAGPCSVESPEQIHDAARLVAACGGRMLRGGAFKPRTSPYGFRGHGRPALGWLREAADAFGLGVATEVMSEREVDAVAAVADLVQIGSRTMQSFALLRAVGEAHKPVLLKRGMAATVEEWLLAGEHLLASGAPSVVFCERGISGADRSTRNLLDLGAVALLANVYRLPVVVDPSHAAGRRDLVLPLARAALAAGAAGLLVEAHPDPTRAQSDGPQALRPPELACVGALVRGAAS